MDMEGFLQEGSDTEEHEIVEFKAALIGSVKSSTSGGRSEELTNSSQNCVAPAVPMTSTSSPSIVIPTTPVSVNSIERTVPSSADAGRYLITEAARISSEVKQLRGELEVAKKRIREQDLELEENRQEISRQEEIITEQNGKIERMTEENRNLDNGVYVDIKELKGLVGKERTGRLEMEAKYEKMRDSCKTLSEEFKQVIGLLTEDDVKNSSPLPPKIPTRRQNEEDEYEDIVPQENKLEALSAFVENKFATWTEAQYKMKTELLNTQSIALEMTNFLNSKTINDSPRKLPLRMVQQKQPNNRLEQPSTPVLKSPPAARPSIPPAAMRELRKIMVKRTVVKPILKTPLGNEMHGVDESKRSRGCFCLCGQEYSSRSNLVIHVRTFTEVGKFKCDICKARFVLYYMLRRHEKEKHKIEPKGKVGCVLCGGVFESFPDLYAHRKTMHSETFHGRRKSENSPRAKRIRKLSKPSDYCYDNDDDDDVSMVDPEKDEVDLDEPIIPLSSDSKSDLPKYERIQRLPHGADPSNNLKCLCGNEYSDEYNLVRHITYYKPKFSCSKCPKRFATIGTLHSHNIRAHQGKYQFGRGRTKPTLASRKLAREMRLRRKLNVETTETVKVASSSASFSGLQHGMNIGRRHQGFYCICGVKFISRKSLDGHVSLHNQGRRRFAEMEEDAGDEDEDKAVKRSNSLHGINPSRPNRCLCGYKVSSKKKLSLHMAYHAERKSFICTECPARFVGIWYLKRHVLQTHANVNISTITSGNVKTECGQCEKEFENLKKLREHIKKAHPTSKSDWNELEEKPNDLEITNVVSTRPRTPSLGKRNLKEVAAQESVTTPKNFPCAHCDEAFSEISHLIRHKLKIHNIETEGFQIGCKECGLAYSTRSAFVRHRMDVHKSWPKRGKSMEKVQMPEISSGPDAPMPEAIPLSDEEQQTNSMLNRRRRRRPTRMPSLSNETLAERTPSTSKQGLHKVDTSKAHLGYYCICGSQFVQRKNLHSHVRRKTSQWNFRCKVCGQYFFYNSTLTRHMMLTHKIKNGRNNKTVGCVICGTTFKHWTELRQHQKLVHNLDEEQDVKPDGVRSATKVLPSPRTPRDSVRNAELPPTLEEAEKPTHGVDVSLAQHGYYCLCGKKCSSERSLTVHISYATKERNLPCHLCPQRFICPSYLKQHIQRSHRTMISCVNRKPAKTCRCQQCGKYFKSNLELIRHTNTIHVRKTKRRVKSDSSRRRPHAKLESGVVHREIKGNLGSPTCSCGKKYLSKSSLLKHIRVIKRGKIFQCQWCHKGFAERCYYKSHVSNLHMVNILEDGLFECRICNTSASPFPSLNEILEHQMQVHSATL